MKNTILLVLLTLCIMACSKLEGQEYEEVNIDIHPQFESFALENGVQLIVDNITGCQYISYYYKGITPRLAANGAQICNDVSNEFPDNEFSTEIPE